MKRLLTLVAATIVSAQTGYCSGPALNTLTSLNSEQTFSAPANDAEGKKQISAQRVPQFPAELNGTFKVTCAGSAELGGIELNFGLQTQNKKVVAISAEMGKTPVGATDAMLLIIDAMTERSYRAPSRLAANWLIENGGGEADELNGYHRGFNLDGVFYNETRGHDQPGVKLYVRKTGPSLSDIAAAFLGSTNSEDYLEVSSMATQLEESVSALADGSLLYKYSAAGQRTFISSEEVDRAVPNLITRSWVKAKISHLKRQHPDVKAEGQCSLKRIAI
ncbi:MAG: hypothetical protein COX65_03705 [Elusimicrobia bacterium CG_4_10_14_0_2_um_filter_56_8]|nr:MAG: hypothetical protein COX65_03705 [Elusimicrobia bacterium CG_4_10_14_0_2_um_filter_56_8]